MICITMSFCEIKRTQKFLIKLLSGLLLSTKHTFPPCSICNKDKIFFINLERHSHDQMSQIYFWTKTEQTQGNELMTPWNHGAPGPEISKDNQEIKSCTRKQNRKQGSQVEIEQKIPERKVGKKQSINSQLLIIENCHCS